jgi:hypothetical protein
MNSTRAPGGPVTYGRADIDGVGRRDLVLVSTTGTVQVRLGGGGRLSAQLRPDASVRLQTLPDMFSTGRQDIVVATSAAGCCGYTTISSNSIVLRALDGRLRALRERSGRILVVPFSSGSGDGYAGIHCDAGHLTATSIVQLGIDRLRAGEGSAAAIAINNDLVEEDISTAVANSPTHQLTNKVFPRRPVSPPTAR